MAAKAVDEKCVALGYRDFDDLIEKIRQTVPLSDLIASLSGIRYARKRGIQFTACCPFHEERVPSFRVNDRAGFYCASTSCGARGGDVFSFVQQYEGLDFLSAVSRVARLVGVPCPDFESGRPMHANPRRRRLRDIKGPIPKAVADEEAPENSVDDWEWAMPPVNDVPSAALTFYLPSKAKFATREFSTLYRYRGTDGKLIHLVGRQDKGPGGRKSILPLTWRKRPEKIGPNDPDADCWVAAGIPEELARPVYRAEQLGRVDPDDETLESLTILYVEGEKTADAAARLVEDIAGPDPLIVLSPQGGSGAAARADWDSLFDYLEMLAGVKLQVIIWPDADQPAKNAARDAVDPVRRSIDLFATAIVRTMAARGKSGFIDIAYVLPPDGVADKWDLADAEQEGWDADRVRRHLEGCISLPSKHLSRLVDPGRHRPGDWDAADADEPDDIMARADTETDPASGMPAAGRIKPRRLPAAAGQPPFRTLGMHRDHYFLHTAGSDRVLRMNIADMRGPKFLSIADYGWFQANYADGRGKVDWMSVANDIVRQCEDRGIWSVNRERREGVWLDGDQIIVNHGRGAIIVDPDGQWRESALFDIDPEGEGEYVYTMDHPIEAPDMANPLAADDPDLLRFVQVMHDLPWAQGSGNHAPVMLGGWLALSFICGILPWRPHVWLDGARGSGKSWVINNIIAEIVDEYGLHIKSNSSEPGIRRRLEDRAMAVVFDEAEAQDAQDRARMQGIIKIMRHITGGDRSEVIQADGGSSDAVSFRPRATFFLSSINFSLLQSSDLTRFARLTFGKPLPHLEFNRKIAGPVSEIVTPQFRRRLAARMILRASAYHGLFETMTDALVKLTECDRRTADVHASLLSGYYLLFEDRPLDLDSILDWIGEGLCRELIRKIRPGEPSSSNPYDHEDILLEILSHRIQIEVDNSRFTETVSMVVQAAIDADDNEEERTSRLSPKSADNRLREMGIRVVREGDPYLDEIIEDQLPEDRTGRLKLEDLYARGGLLIARNHPELRRILDNTSWRDSYHNVLLQTPGAVNVGRLRFAGSTRHNCFFIPFLSMPMLVTSMKKPPRLLQPAEG